MKTNAPILPISIAYLPGRLNLLWRRFGLQPEERKRLFDVLDPAPVSTVERGEYLDRSFVHGGREQERLGVRCHEDRVRLDRQRKTRDAAVPVDVELPDFAPGFFLRPFAAPMHQ